jgi:hypothetical protein
MWRAAVRHDVPISLVSCKCFERTFENENSAHKMINQCGKLQTNPKTRVSFLFHSVHKKQTFLLAMAKSSKFAQNLQFLQKSAVFEWRSILGRREVDLFMNPHF